MAQTEYKKQSGCTNLRRIFNLNYLWLSPPSQVFLQENWTTKSQQLKRKRNCVSYKLSGPQGRTPANFGFSNIFSYIHLSSPPSSKTVEKLYLGNIYFSTILKAVGTFIYYLEFWNVFNIIFFFGFPHFHEIQCDLSYLAIIMYLRATLS